MRNTKCPFCEKIFNDKHKYCKHIAMIHNDQIPEQYEPLEYAYSLLVHKDPGRLCVICRKNPVHFNQETLKYERFCGDPKCKEEYAYNIAKRRMVNKYGSEHLLDDADTQRKMIHNHPNATDFKWDDKHVFRVIGSYEIDFLKKLQELDWSPADIIAPSPNNYYYRWKDGSIHLYIPDFYIPSLCLEVEIKEGTNQHPRMEHAREMEHLKDAYMAVDSRKNGIHYIKIVDKNYDEFMRDYVKSDTNAPE